MFELKDTEQAYIKAAIRGLIIGPVTETCNLLPNDGLPGLSSLAGSYVFEKLTKWSNING